jgi:hypothetical protein
MKCCLASPLLELQQKHSERQQNMPVLLLLSTAWQATGKLAHLAPSHYFDARRSWQVGEGQAGNMLRDGSKSGNGTRQIAWPQGAAVIQKDSRCCDGGRGYLKPNQRSCSYRAAVAIHIELFSFATIFGEFSITEDFCCSSGMIGRADPWPSP